MLPAIGLGWAEEALRVGLRMDHALPSPQMDDQHGAEPTQQTQPKKGEPITIPVPKRGDVMAFFEKTAKLPDPDRSGAERPAE